jgi:type IV pilus assembly protein PilA
MKKFFKNPSGFTLVELMVVVAIIGILSAIAVPNFKKYQAKSKQSEAKIQLAAIYNSEVGAQSDYDTYATCLLKMGYEQSPRGYYIVGFKSGIDASAKFPLCTIGGVAGPGKATDQVASSMIPEVQLAALTAEKPVILSTASVTTQTSFTASAQASLTAGKQDIWTIDQNKKLDNTSLGY